MWPNSSIHPSIHYNHRLVLIRVSGCWSCYFCTGSLLGSNFGEESHQVPMERKWEKWSTYQSTASILSCPWYTTSVFFRNCTGSPGRAIKEAVSKAYRIKRDVPLPFIVRVQRVWKHVMTDEPPYIFVAGSVWVRPLGGKGVCSLQPFLSQCSYTRLSFSLVVITQF